MSAQSSLVMRAKSVATLAPLLYTTEANYFQAQPYSVANLTTRDFTRVTPLKAVTQFNQLVIFERDKDHDYFDVDQIEIVVGAATHNVAATTEQYVDGAGYLMIQRPVYKLHSNQLNSVVVPYEWAALKDRLRWHCTRENMQVCDNLNYLADQNAAFLAAALASGWTFVVDFDLGLEHESKEIMQFIVAFNIRPRFEFYLPKLEQVVDLKGLSTISNSSTLITSVTLIQNNIHISGYERDQEIARYDDDNGIFHLTHRFEVEEYTIPHNRNFFDVPLLTTGTHEAAFFIFRPESRLVANLSDPLFWTWGTPNATRTSYTQTIGGNTLTRPERFDIRASNGNIIFPGM